MDENPYRSPLSPAGEPPKPIKWRKALFYLPYGVAAYFGTRVMNKTAIQFFTAACIAISVGGLGIIAVKRLIDCRGRAT